MEFFLWRNSGIYLTSTPRIFTLQYAVKGTISFIIWTQNLENDTGEPNNVFVFPKVFKFNDKSLSHKFIFIDVWINESHELAQILIRSESCVWQLILYRWYYLKSNVCALGHKKWKKINVESQILLLNTQKISGSN